MSYARGVRRPLILLAAVALLAAGCGGGGGGSGATTAANPTPPLTRSQYQARLRSLIDGISKSIGKTATSASKLTKADVDRVADAFRTFAERLRQVKPPPAVQALHDRLTQAMGQLADDFPDIAKRLEEAKDPTAAISALLGARAVQQLNRVITELRAKGYKLDFSG